MVSSTNDVGKWNICMQKNKLGPLSPTTYKEKQLKMNEFKFKK